MSCTWWPGSVCSTSSPSCQTPTRSGSAIDPPGRDGPGQGSGLRSTRGSDTVPTAWSARSSSSEKFRLPGGSLAADSISAAFFCMSAAVPPPSRVAFTVALRSVASTSRTDLVSTPTARAADPISSEIRSPPAAPSSPLLCAMTACRMFQLRASSTPPPTHSDHTGLGDIPAIVVTVTQAPDAVSVPTMCHRTMRERPAE